MWKKIGSGLKRVVLNVVIIGILVKYLGAAPAALIVVVVLIYRNRNAI